MRKIVLVNMLLFFCVFAHGQNNMHRDNFVGVWDLSARAALESGIILQMLAKQTNKVDGTYTLLAVTTFESTEGEVFLTAQYSVNGEWEVIGDKWFFKRIDYSLVEFESRIPAITEAAFISELDESLNKTKQSTIEEVSANKIVVKSENGAVNVLNRRSP